MNKDQIIQIMERAKKDPDFFYQLIFDPNKIIANAKELDPSTQEVLLNAKPAVALQSLMNEQDSSVQCQSTCSVTNNILRKSTVGGLDARFMNRAVICDDTYTCCCTSGTCGSTCGGSTCDVTCSGSSCGVTCGDSCGYTTHLQYRF